MSDTAIQVAEAATLAAAGTPGAPAAKAAEESVKAAADVYAPVAGEVVARNDALAEAPNGVNKDPYAAWLFRIKPAAGARLDNLMDARTYRGSFSQT